MRHLAVCALACFVHSALAAPPVFSAYTKLKSNTLGVWSEETGFSAVWRRQGNLSLESNLAFMNRIPFRSENGTQFAAGATARYRFGAKADTLQPAVYAKIKHDLFHTFSQELGVSASLWRQDRWSLGFNAAFVYPYPLRIQKTVPGYTVGLTLFRRL